MTDRLALEISRAVARSRPTTMRFGTISTGDQVLMADSTTIWVDYWIGDWPGVGATVVVMMFDGTLLGFGLGGLSTAWTHVSYASNFSDYSASYPVQYRKSGNGVVFVRGLLKCSTTAAVETVLFVLPAGFRPSQTLHLATSCVSQYAVLGVDPGGAFRFKTAYPTANAWYSVTCNYLAEQ